MSSRARLAIVAVAVIGLVVAFVVASGSGDDGDDESAATTAAVTAQAPAATAEAPVSTGETTTPAATTTTPAAPPIPVIEVVDAKPKGGIQRLDFDKGDRIRFVVTSDTADEIHVHGYDIAKDVAAGGSVTFSFDGDIDGRFEVELESRGVQIAELRVNP